MTPATGRKPFDARRSVRRHVIAGVALVVALVGGIGGWAAGTEIAGALIAQGQVVVDSSVKKVQHPSGGVVGELNVRDGDKVQAGDVLLRLDETMLKANLEIVLSTLDELSARAARLQAERDDEAALAFPADIEARRGDPNVARILDGEEKLFQLRRSARLGQEQQLGQRIEQIEEQIGGLQAQRDAKARQIAFVRDELQGVKALWDKNLTTTNRMSELQRQEVELDGAHAELIAAIAEAKGKIAETRMQILQIGQELASEVAKELREIEAKMREYKERRVAADDQLRRTDIRAPQSGIVHELTVHTVGGVVTAGEPIMLIVPTDDRLVVEAKVAPQDIDRLQPGQPAALRFSAFNARTTPQIDGHVVRISANTVTDERKGLVYYTARISIPPEELARLGDEKIVPGMVVEAFIKTGERTVLSYLLKPLSDQVMRAFRER